MSFAISKDTRADGVSGDRSFAKDIECSVVKRCEQGGGVPNVQFRRMIAS